MSQNCGVSGCFNSTVEGSAFCWLHLPGPVVHQNKPGTPMIYDPVNKPLHYNQGKFEVLDVIEDNLKEGFEAYLVGNVLKYVMRYKHKNGIQDLEKAQFYLKRLIQKKGEKNGNETK